jgi:hypothetical protein
MKLTEYLSFHVTQIPLVEKNLQYWQKCFTDVADSPGVSIIAVANETAVERIGTSTVKARVGITRVDNCKRKQNGIADGIDSLT